jgi:hypothetical protein
MTRSTAWTSVVAVLLVCLTLVMLVSSLKGQEMTSSVKGFPFVQLGKTYSNGTYEFQILQDAGNGWVAARSAIGNTSLFVNLHQMPMLFPRD